MADQKLGLPVRTEADADERIQTKLVDYTTPSQGATIDANGDLHTRSKLVDESGADYSFTNPLPVSNVESEGDEVSDYDTAAAVASDGTSNHDYTVSGGKTFLLDRAWSSASSRSKVELQVETGVATDTWTTVAVGFGTTSSPNVELVPQKRVKAAAGVRIRMIRTNRDNQAQDLYSTFYGIEV